MCRWQERLPCPRSKLVCPDVQVAEAKTRWEAEYNGQYIDDISAVVVLLHEQTNSTLQHQISAKENAS